MDPESATLESPRDSSGPLPIVPAQKTVPPRDYSHLKHYHFKPGNQIAKLGGRPKGVLNSQTILMKSAPKLARTYVREALKGSTPLLVDARKWILPVEQLIPQSTVTIVTTAHNILGEDYRVEMTRSCDPQSLIEQSSNPQPPENVL